MRCWPAVGVVALSTIVFGASGANAQAPRAGRLGGAGQAADSGAVTPAEIQRMFDAYALLQAQEQLKINDEQYAQFLTRFKALQDARRQGLNQRTRIILDLRRMLMEGQTDEAQFKDRLKQLDELETKSAADVRKAYEAVDQVLDVRQQAQFRVFEELMERRKLELVTRARLANRAKPQ